MNKPAMRATFQGRDIPFLSLTQEQVDDMIIGSRNGLPLTHRQRSDFPGCQPAVFMTEADVRRIVKEEIEKALAKLPPMNDLIRYSGSPVPVNEGVVAAGKASKKYMEFYKEMVEIGRYPK